jgi:molecular chaperone DnaK (HSP70)
MLHLLKYKQLWEMTEHSNDYCGGLFVDLEFVEYIKKKIGSKALVLLEENNYAQYKYMIKDFCENVKFKFKDDVEFEYEFNLEEHCPMLKDLVDDDDKRQSMENCKWIIDLNYETVKSFFDRMVDRIVQLIHNQLNKSNECSAIFLVGGFSESAYLQKVITEEFKTRVNIIEVPPQPQCAVMRGATEFGLNSLAK